MANKRRQSSPPAKSGGTPVQRAKRAAQQARWQAQRAKYAAETAAWQQVTNSYQGGVPTRMSETWPVSTGDRFGSTLDRWQLGNARDRAYNAFRNNPVARTLVQTECDNVIGDGLNYQPTSDSPAWNREAKDKYYEWQENCSVRGPDVHSGCEIQRLLWQRSRVAGDVGWILVAQGADSRIQVVPAENIATPDGMQADESVFDGIRFDALGRPVAFYLMPKKRQGDRTSVTVVARDFVFLPHHSEPSQARGESCFLTIFDLLAHLDRYVDGVSLAAWMSTVFGLIFKDAGSAKQYTGLPTVSNSQGVQQRAVTLENGSVKYIAPEGEVVQVDAKQPMNQTPEFIRTIMRLIGQPFDMPLAVVFKDTSQENFASARIGLLPFYRSCRIKAARFGGRWSRTIRWWLSRENLRARDDPKRWTTAFPENYWSHELRPNAWKYTDPVSELQGDQLACNAGLKSPQMVIEEQGGDVAETIRQLEEWQTLTKNLPQVFSTLTRDPTPVPVAAPPVDQPNQQDNANADE